MSEVERYDLCEFNNGLVVRKGGFLVRAEEYDEVCERLTAAEQFVRKLIDCAKNQDSIATAYTFSPLITSRMSDKYPVG